MGVRNPFRFAVDPHTDNLYWGDVGPDETAPNVARGPLGMDEINQLKFDEPGNYGWPYCIGPNLPYVNFDYATQQSTGVHFDCENPSNFSPNNKGAKTGELRMLLGGLEVIFTGRAMRFAVEQVITAAL
jgi:cytochrome c